MSDSSHRFVSMGMSFSASSELRIESPENVMGCLAGVRTWSEFLQLESIPHGEEPRPTLRRKRPTKVQEDLERRSAGFVEELNAACRRAIHVPRFFHGEHRCQL